MIPRFDPTRAVVFDLGRGQLRDDEGVGRLNLPAEALLRLCAAASEEARRDFGRGLGTELGRRVLRKLGDAAESAAPSAWIEHLGGELALCGLGNLSLERWGRALVFVVTGPPRAPEPALLQELLAALFEGSLQRALGRDVAFLPLGEGAEGLRFVVVHRGALEKARGWLAEGASLGEIVERLHGGRGNA